MDIKFQTIIDYKTLRDFFRANTFGFKHNKVKFILWEVFCLFFVGFTYMSGEFFGWDTTLYLSMITLIICSIFFLFLYFVLPKINYNAQKKLVGTVVDYTFTDDGFCVYANRPDGVNSVDNMLYNAVQRVCINDKYMYIYITKITAHIITIDNANASDIFNIKNKFIQNGIKVKDCSEF